MATSVVMPKQGQSVESCIITRWFRQKGEKIAEGDILCSYETDKAAFDLESPAGGTLLEVFFKEGDDVPVLADIAVIGEPGEEITSSLPDNKDKAGQDKEPDRRIQNSEYQDTKARSGIRENQRIRISPRAKRLAEETGINPENIKGSGPGSRITVNDIQNAAAAGKSEAGTAGAQTPEYEDRPLSNIRRRIAGAMLSSLQNSAQVTHHMGADARSILNARQKIKNYIREGKIQPDISLNDMICMCVIRALEKNPEINSHLKEDTLRVFKRINLGIAVDTPRGLMVPSIKEADTMDLIQLSSSLKSAAEGCRKGNIDPEILKSTSASFTVSNLGSYGVEMFTPVINLPQVAILGVCAIVNRPADIGNNTFGFVPYIGLSLTYDHRAVDGGPATLFLKEVKEEIEKFDY